MTLDAQRAKVYLGALAGLLHRAVGAGVRVSILDMVAHVTKNKLRGQYLRRRTGTLIRSITASPRFATTPELVSGTLGSNLDYARVHEEGFVGRVQVKAHVRRLVGPASSRAGARRLRKALIAGRSTVAHVRAHSRHVNVRARHFLRDTVSEKRGEAGINVRKGIVLLAETGKVPTTGEIRSRSRLTIAQLRGF